MLRQAGVADNREDALDVRVEQTLAQDALPDHARCSEENHFHYAKNQPNAFVVGFGILEEWAHNRANLYVPIVMDGKFSFGGKLYEI